MVMAIELLVEAVGVHNKSNSNTNKNCNSKGNRKIESNRGSGNASEQKSN